MKSDADPKPISPGKAMGCMAANLLVAPGLGSWMARQYGLAIGQFLLALVGVLLFLAWFVDVLRQYYGLIENDVTPHLHHWLALSGLGIFLVAWCWALVTSIGVVRAARRRERAAALGHLPADAVVPPRLQGDR